MEISLIPLIFTLTIITVFKNVSPVPVGTRILSQTSHLQDNGYQFQYESEDGSHREEIGTLVYKENEKEPMLLVRGLYSYFDGDGRKYVVRYQADDGGYKTDGNIVQSTITTKNFGGDGRRYVDHYEADDNGYNSGGDFVFPDQNFNATMETTTPDSKLIELFIGTAVLGTLLGGNTG